MKQSTLAGKPHEKVMQALETARISFVWNHSAHPEQVEMNDETLKDLIAYWVDKYGEAPIDILGMRITRNNSLRHGQFLMVEKADNDKNGH